ncbi:MAG: hypothetical protein AAFV43_15985 [Planctomycetota bacterium]
MNANQQDLWRRIEAFELDAPGASLTFTKRLARENGWSHHYARRVVAEYQRFVFLAMTAGHEVTPSDEVDQAWHLHLTYTRSYWDELCGRVLGQPLHHGPTKGGSSEGARFEDQYARTFESYRRAFGEEPPADIWPPAETRFGEAPHWVRVNTQRDWVVAKPWRTGRPLTVVAGLIGVGLTIPLAQADDDAKAFLIIGGVLLAAFAVIAVARLAGTNNASTNKKSSGDSGCAAHTPPLYGSDSGDSGGSDAGGGGDGGGCGGGGCGGGCGGCGG